MPPLQRNRQYVRNQQQQGSGPQQNANRGPVGQQQVGHPQGNWQQGGGGPQSGQPQSTGLLDRIDQTANTPLRFQMARPRSATIRSSSLRPIRLTCPVRVKPQGPLQATGPVGFSGPRQASGPVGFSGPNQASGPVGFSGPSQMSPTAGNVSVPASSTGSRPVPALTPASASSSTPIPASISEHLIATSRDRVHRLNRPLFNVG